jgi:methylenetetrahydrofolate reductase (NADPH)
LESAGKTFRKALQGTGFPITAELFLRRQSTVDDALQQASQLTGYVDAVQVADNPNSWVQISPLALSSLLIRQGIDPIPRLSCRDRNRIALQSDLLGLRAMGVSSLILVKGSPLPEGNDLNAKPVFDLNCPELVTMAQAMNEEDWPGAGHEFVIGTGATVFGPEPGWKADYLLARAKAGARFLQTQPCFNLVLLRRYLQGLVQAKVTWKYSVIVTLAPLPSANMARWLAENHQGTLIPDALIERLKNSADPEREGIEICTSLMREIVDIPGVSGINLLTLGRPEAVVAAIEAFRR